MSGWDPATHTVRPGRLRPSWDRKSCVPPAPYPERRFPRRAVCSRTPELGTGHVGARSNRSGRRGAHGVAALTACAHFMPNHARPDAVPDGAKGGEKSFLTYARAKAGSRGIAPRRFTIATSSSHSPRPRSETLGASERLTAKALNRERYEPSRTLPRSAVRSHSHLSGVGFANGRSPGRACCEQKNRVATRPLS